MFDFRKSQEGRKFCSDNNTVIPWDESERSVAIAMRRLNKAMFNQRTAIKRREQCVTRTAYRKLKHKAILSRQRKQNGLMNRLNDNQ